MQIGVIGAGTCGQKLAKLAYDTGYHIAKNGASLICGGLGGVDIKIVTGLSHARNIIIVRSSQAIIAIGGEYGTLSEIAFALKLNVPIVGLETWNLGDNIPMIVAKNPKEAVELALKLGKVS